MCAFGLGGVCVCVCGFGVGAVQTGAVSAGVQVHREADERVAG